LLCLADADELFHGDFLCRNARSLVIPGRLIQLRDCGLGSGDGEPCVRFFQLMPPIRPSDQVGQKDIRLLRTWLDSSDRPQQERGCAWEDITASDLLDLDPPLSST